jgi:ElaB/YqjD/DUF883 family membrane-anchored ribosome-binding protein
MFQKEKVEEKMTQIKAKIEWLIEELKALVIWIAQKAGEFIQILVARAVELYNKLQMAFEEWKAARAAAKEAEEVTA